MTGWPRATLDAMRSIGEVTVTRRHVFRALVALHVGTLALPFAAFVFRGVTVGHQGFESLGWITYLLAAAGLGALLLLAATGAVVPLVLADAVLGGWLLTQPPMAVALIGIWFLMLAVLGAVLQGIVVRKWLASHRASSARTE